MRTDCFKCYSILERTPVRTVDLSSGLAKVGVVRVRCPGCGKDFGEDYDVHPVASDPAASRERRLARQRAGKQRYLQNQQQRIYQKVLRELTGGK